MAPLVAAGIISAGAGLLSNIFGTSKDLSNSRKLLNYQHQLALEDWNRQNAYNAPIAQMDRLKEAGLNPNLIYGSGNSVGNTTTSVQQPSYNKLDNYSRLSEGVTNSIDHVLSVYRQNQEIENLKVQNEKTKAETAAIKNENSVFDQRWINENNTAQANIANIRQNTNLTKERIGNVAADTILKQTQNSVQQSSKKEIEKKIELLGKEIGLKQGEIELLKSRAWLMAAQANAATASAALSYANANASYIKQNGYILDNYITAVRAGSIDDICRLEVEKAVIANGNSALSYRYRLDYGVDNPGGLQSTAGGSIGFGPFKFSLNASKPYALTKGLKLSDFMKRGLRM